MSNLPFISKILEKVILTQLQKYLSENEIKQSAYKKNHNTETALLSVVDGLLRNAVDKLVSVLALLDLSAAFDMLDHPILLQRLETTFDISGTVLHWFASYLEGREQSVKVCVYWLDMYPGASLPRTLYMNKPLLYSGCFCRLIILISFNFWSVVRVVSGRIIFTALLCREFNLFLRTSLHPSHTTDA